MRPDFEEKLKSFVDGCQQRVHDDHYLSTYPLKRWVRIERRSPSSSGVFCFVDIETGEVLKPAGWKRPALTKTKRGNIFDEHNGLQHIGPYGVAYADKIKGIDKKIVRFTVGDVTVVES